MLIKIGAFLASALAFFAALFFARRDGANSAKVDALRREIERNAKEQERANEINARVDNADINTVRERLSNLKGK